MYIVTVEYSYSWNTHTHARLPSASMLLGLISTLTSQGSGTPTDPGRNRPADISSHTLLNAPTNERGSSPISGTIEQ